MLEPCNSKAATEKPSQIGISLCLLLRGVGVV